MHNKTVVALVAGALAAVMTGCGDAPDNEPLAGEVHSISVDANGTSMFATENIQMLATGYYTLDVPERDITENISWTSSNTTIADVDALGVVSGGEFGGEVIITGTYDMFEESATLTIYPMTGVQIIADETNLTQEQTVHFQAKGTFDDGAGSTLNVTTGVTWILGGADESNATLDANGTLYTGDANGTLEVNVSRYDINDSISITVTP